ncbi:MAG: hypothetical protein AVO33_00680 [delta proteobacterium ML8_F1]|nr:MAG: hypothetical protein AVO33_00680 [delta proteobacterium ML8_F1]
MIMIIYGLLVTAAGLFFYRRLHNIDDFILGNRGLNYWVIGLSAQTSLLGGWIFLGLPSLGFSIGLGGLWVLLGVIAGSLLNWRFIAIRLRVFSTRSENALTLPSYFQKRFKSNRIGLRLLISLLILGSYLIYTAAGLSVAGRVVQLILGVEYLAALLIVTLLVAGYTVSGGFTAVNWTDVLQSLLILLAAVILPLVTLGQLGGGQRALMLLQELPDDFLSLTGESMGWIRGVSFFALGFAVLGQPHVVTRFMAIDEIENINYASFIGLLWTVAVLLGAFGLGLLGRAYYPGTCPFELEFLYYQLTTTFFSGFLGDLLKIAFLAALMSTVDSKLMVTVSVFVEDFYKIMIHREIPSQAQVLMGRITVAIMALVAFLLALDPGSSLYGLVGLVWVGLGSTLGPAMVFSLFYWKTTYRGVFSGIAVGGLVLLFWELMLSGGLFDLTGLIPAALITSAVIWQVSKRDTLHHEFEQFSELLK